MPYQPTNPPTVAAFVPSPHAVDTFYMRSVNIRLVPGDLAAVEIDVEWAEGFMDGGAFYIAPQADGVLGGIKQATLSGPTLVAAMNAPVVPGKTHYDDFRDALWTYMMNQDLIPPGTIT
jgi:hypothetical protein